MGRFIANLVAGKLDIEVARLIRSKIQRHTNHSTVARPVNGRLRMLWLRGVHDGKVLICIQTLQHIC
jgi:hypothetical protein